MKVLLFITTLALLWSCSEEEVSPREYTRLRTRNVSNVTSTSATLTAEVTYYKEVTDHGFVWTQFGFADLDDPDSKSVSLGTRAAIGEFKSDISGLKPGTKYWIRSYAKSGKFVVYGDQIFFTTLR